MKAPKISVIVPVYRGESTLSGALESLLNQAEETLEILVLDDGSPDGSRQIAERIAAEAVPETVVVHSRPNRGLAATLNWGISLAIGEFVARQDQDDLVLPGRLRKQRAFLEAHPDVALVGTWAHIYVGDHPSDRYHRHPTTDDALRLELLFDNPFVHSSVMMRADVVRSLGGYSEDRNRQPPEDYELWSRIARHHRVANLPEVLTVYREMPGSMSRVGENPFSKNVIKIASENLEQALGHQFSSADCSALAKLYHGAADSPRLPSRHARRMLEAAARAVGGDPTNWSNEFHDSLTRMRRHLDSRYLRRRVPGPLLPLARWLKRRIPRRGR